MEVLKLGSSKVLKWNALRAWLRGCSRKGAKTQGLGFGIAGLFLDRIYRIEQDCLASGGMWEAVGECNRVLSSAVKKNSNQAFAPLRLCERKIRSQEYMRPEGEVLFNPVNPVKKRGIPESLSEAGLSADRRISLGHWIFPSPFPSFRFSVIPSFFTVFPPACALGRRGAICFCRTLGSVHRADESCRRCSYGRHGRRGKGNRRWR